MSEKKNKWLIPVLLFVILVIMYVVRGFFGGQIDLQMITVDKIEESCEAIGVLIKDESLSTIHLNGGAMEVSADVGDRVSTGQVIATLYGNAADETVKAEFSDINRRIRAIEKSKTDDAVFINDATKIESEIETDVNTLLGEVAQSDYSRIGEHKATLAALADQKAVAKGEKNALRDELSALVSQKSMLESKLGKIAGVYSAQRAGVFVEGTDGLEADLSKDSLLGLTTDKISEIIAKDKNGEVQNSNAEEYTYKIVDNYMYYVAMNLPIAQADNVKQGDSVYIRFTDFSAENVTATVVSVSDADKNGNCVVCVSCTAYVEHLLENRVVNVQFIRKSVSGYKVDVAYLHTVDNQLGLFMKRGAVMRFIPVEIVYNNQQEAIVSAANSDTPIKAYDEVVIHAPVFEDGRVIVNQ